jgi:signal transduction histidine kinase
VTGGSPGRFGTTSLFWLLQLSGWLAFAVLMVAWGLAYWTLRETLLNKAVLVGTGFGLTLAFPGALRRLGSAPPVAAALGVGALAFGSAALWAEVYGVFLEARAVGRLRLVPLPIGTVVLYGFVLLAWSLLYLGIHASLALKAEQARAVRAEALAHEAQLRALRSQLEPHFLFNTLNAISTLVAAEETNRALEMIGSLGEFLRTTLDNLEAPEVSLAEELDLTRQYLAIQKARFGDRIRVEIDAAQGVLSGKVPTLILQPLVENALKHGVLPREEGGSVLIAARLVGGHLEISVVDDGLGLKDGDLRKGLGLSNTEARLRELYGAAAALSLERGREGGLAATLRIPLSRAASP